MSGSEAEDENTQLWWRLEVLEYEHRTDAALAGYGRIHALLLGLMLAATFLPLWESTPGGETGDNLWQVAARSGLSPIAGSLGLLVVIFLVLMVSVALWPRGGVKPLAILILAVTLGAALLFLPARGHVPDSGAWALLTGLALIVLVSVAHGIHASTVRQRYSNLLADGALT